MKTCSVCKNVKPIDAFYNYKATKDGKSYRCKTCDDTARLKWSTNNPEKARSSARGRSLKHKYGIDLVWYAEQLKNQNNSCAICGTEENKVGGRYGSLSFAVDHCHSTGYIRGLLCNPCNRALGLFKDSLDIVNKAFKYLKGDPLNVASKQHSS